MNNDCPEEKLKKEEAPQPPAPQHFAASLTADAQAQAPQHFAASPTAGVQAQTGEILLSVLRVPEAQPN
jgi:hypothetical protein